MNIVIDKNNAAISSTRLSNYRNWTGLSNERKEEECRKKTRIIERNLLLGIVIVICCTYA